MSFVFASCFSENLCASSDLSRRVVYLLEWSSLLSGKESLDVERLMPFQAFSVLGRCQAADIGEYLRICLLLERAQPNNTAPCLLQNLRFRLAPFALGGFTVPRPHWHLGARKVWYL